MAWHTLDSMFLCFHVDGGKCRRKTPILINTCVHVEQAQVVLLIFKVFINIPVSLLQLSASPVDFFGYFFHSVPPSPLKELFTDYVYTEASACLTCHHTNGCQTFLGYCKCEDVVVALINIDIIQRNCYSNYYYYFANMAVLVTTRLSEVVQVNITLAVRETTREWKYQKLNTQVESSMSHFKDKGR